MADGNYIQQSFVGGLNQEIDATRLNRNEYPLLINGRSRYDVITNSRLPKQVMDNALNGANYQGLIAANNILFIFVDGKAFFKDLDYPDSGFQPVIAPQLDANVPIIYTELVPASYTNFQRTLLKTNNNKNSDVLLGDLVNQTPQCLVAQDGISQPVGIFTTLQGRELKRYAEWNLQDREYVPVGKQMLFHNGILYVISKDSKRIYKSLTGRALDFMVNIMPGDDGDKWPDEKDGNADTVAHSVDYDDITSINRLATDDGSFFVSTKKASYAVVPLEDEFNILFGEPSYANRFLFSAGCISPFGFIELLGDNAFQDFNGLRSFNAILQLKNEGSNSPFSKKLGPILQGITQDYVAAINFDNYAIFACNTIYGRGLIFYDTLRQTFDALDIYPGVSQIKQFAEVKNSAGVRSLWFITTDNKLYQAFEGGVAPIQLYVGEWCSNDPKSEQRFANVKLVFVDCKEEGNISLQTFVDRKLNQTQRKILEQQSNNPNNITPIQVPFGTSDVDNVQNLSFDISRVKQGWKAGFLISWDVEATLSHIGVTSSIEPNINSISTSAKQYNRNLAIINGGQ